MYTRNSKNLKVLINRILMKGFHSLTEKQKTIILQNTKNIKIINTREVFVFWILCFVYTKPKHSVIVTLNDNTKFICDFSNKQMAHYSIYDYIVN